MIPTTVIGSFPAPLEGGSYARSYFDGEPRDAGRDSLELAVKSQAEAGIDIVADGQTKSDFITLFAKSFRGVVMQTRPVVIGELEHVSYATVDDQKLAKSLLPKGTKLKGIMTGPYTMAKNTNDMHYGDIEELAFAYASGLAKEAKELSNIVDYVQVDEPFFSVDFPGYGKDLLGEFFSDVSVPKMLHVCGDVSHIFADLVEYPVDYLEHEFAASPQIWDVAADIDFPQTLGVGVARSDKNKAESVKEISTRMETAISMLDPSKLMFNPDCGLRNLDLSVASEKLSNIVAARDGLENG